MQPSPEMQSFVHACETLHSTYLDDAGDRLKMRLNRTDLPLVIERTGLNTVRVAHKLVGPDGQVVFDPEVTFFTGYEKWIAMEIAGPSTLATEVGKRGTRKRYVELNSTETAVKSYTVGKQKELAQFVKYWVRCLRARGWHENSTDALNQQTSFLDDEYGRIDPLHQDDDGNESETVEHLKDVVEDKLVDAGLMDDMPRSRRSRRGSGIEGVTISSGDRSVTLNK